MRKLIQKISAFLLGAFVLLILSPLAIGQSVRQERRLINSGNTLYKEGKYTEALQKYKGALEINGQSDVAKFNLGLTQIRISDKGGKQEMDSLSKVLYEQGVGLLTQVAQIGDKKADLSSKANYNLGNLHFEKEDYGTAIQFYKQALRLNPGFENARRNLRIAQLRQQNQQDDKQDQNKDQNKDQQDQKDQNQDQDKQDKQDQNQDQNKDQQDKDKQDQQQQQPKENEINPQTAQQILNAVENNEAQTRARHSSNKGDKKAVGAGGNQRKW